MLGAGPGAGTPLFPLPHVAAKPWLLLQGPETYVSNPSRLLVVPWLKGSSANLNPGLSDPNGFLKSECSPERRHGWIRENQGA